MRKMYWQFCTVCVAVLINLTAEAQEYDQMPQINYEEIPASVQNSLFDEIEKMNLDNIRFNFHRYQVSGDYIVVFLRKGVDLTALGGLETIIFDPEGEIQERRYKYYSEEILVAIPLELIMTLQEKTKDIELNYLTKIETSGGNVTYHAVSPDSAYVFNQNMEYITVRTSDQYMDDLTNQ